MKIYTKILFIICVIVFTLYNAVSQSKLNLGGDKVAKVNSRIITVKELENEFNQRQKLVDQSGKPITVDGGPLTKKAVLESMIDDELLTGEVKSKNIIPNDNEVQGTLEQYKQMYVQAMTSKDPAFKYSDDAYSAYLEKEVKVTKDKLVDKVKNTVMVKQYIQKRCEKKIADVDTKQYSDTVLENFYDQNVNSFVRPKSIELKHILLWTLNPETKQPFTADAKLVIKKKADDILARIKKGESFDSLCELYSEDPDTKGATNPNTGKIDRGYMGMIPISGQVADYLKNVLLGEELFNTLFKLDKGLTGVMESKVGYHIFLILDKKSQYISPFSAEKANIVTYMKNLDKNKIMQDDFTALMKELRAKATIQYYMDEYK
jgi:foldase protein PrsA